MVTCGYGGTNVGLRFYQLDRCGCEDCVIAC